MLFSVEQAFVGREEIRAPLKRPAWEATKRPVSTKLSEFILGPADEGIETKETNYSYLNLNMSSCFILSSALGANYHFS